jgi:predicted MFS family arabinose efflux permease
MVGASIWSWWASWLLLACIAEFTRPPTWSTAVASRFRSQRALALAFIFSGAGLASATVPMISNALLDAYGWRGVYFGLAAGGAILILPLLVLLFRDARTRPFIRRGAAAGAVAPVYTGMNARDAFRSRHFFQLTIASLLLTALAVSMTVHFVPMLVDSGLSRGQAAMLAGLIGVGSITGRLVTGVLLDRLNGPLIGTISFLMPIPVCIILLTLDASVTTASFAALLFGLSIGAESDVIAYMSTRYFGLKRFGTIYSTMIGVTALGSTAPSLSGHVFDVTGSYSLVLQAMIPLYLLSAVMVGTLGRYPTFGLEPAK